MKAFVKFLIIFGIILIASAVLSPFLYQHLPFKFEKIFNRLVMIFSLAAIAFFVRLRRDMFEMYRPYWTKSGMGLFWITFAVAILILSALALTKGMLGDAVWALSDQSVWAWIFQVIRLFLTGLLIGVIEEFFFRNYIFLTLNQRFKWNLLVCVLITSVFYSLIHFINFEKPLILGDPTLWDGFRLIAMPITNMTKIQYFWPAAIGLFLFGLILNDLVIRTRSIYPSIGLHAGCVFFVKIDSSFADFLNNNPLLFATKTMYDGALGWLFLILMWFVLRIVVKPVSK